MTGFSGSDDLLACFVAGNAFSWDDWFRKETEEAHFQEVIDMMLNLAVFVYIGAIIVNYYFLFKRESLFIHFILFYL
jgi:NhaP-type Na+/H+ or K+/H+ antiporter